MEAANAEIMFILLMCIAWQECEARDGRASG
jgi:hypothetical protein